MIIRLYTYLILAFLIGALLGGVAGSWLTQWHMLAVLWR